MKADKTKKEAKDRNQAVEKQVSNMVDNGIFWYVCREVLWQVTSQMHSYVAGEIWWRFRDMLEEKLNESR